MKEENISVIKALAVHANEITSGSYANINKIFGLTDSNINSTEIADLAEAFGKMSVKIEAREFALEQTIEELQRKKTELDKTIKIREIAGNIFVIFALCISVFIFLFTFVEMPSIELNFKTTLSRWFGISFTSGILIILSLFARKSGLPWSAYGLNLDNLKKSIIESVLVSSFIILILVFIKYYLMKTTKLFDSGLIIDTKDIDLFFWTYLLVAPLQEFIMRGVLQSSIERILTGKYKIFWTVLTTSFLFGALHSIYSFQFGIVSLCAGILWGWLFIRHRNLVGVSISHVIIGHTFILLEFWEFLAF